MKGALDVHRALLDREVPHEILRLPRMVFNAEEIPETLGLPATRCLTTRLYYADGQLTALAMPALSMLQPAAIMHVLGAMSLSPATSRQTNETTDYAAGLVCPALLPADIPLFVDAAVDTSDSLYMPTGDASTALGVRAGDFFVVTGARVAHFDVPDVIQLPEDVTTLDVPRH